MKKDRLQNRVAASPFTLPVAAIISTLLWWSEGIYTFSFLAGWMLCGLTTYLWVETNNTYSLLRIRSLLTPGIHIMLTGALFFLHPLQAGSIVTCCMLISYFLLFGTYQQPYAIVPMFHAFLSIGIGSLFFPQIICFVPFLLCYAALQLRSLTWHTFWAAMAGILLPYWFWGGYCFYSDDFAPLLDHIQELAAFLPVGPRDYQEWDSLQLASVSYVTFFAMVGILHYVRTSFNDKIRTRMLLYILLSQEMLIVTFLILQPVHFNILSGLLVMNSAPFISHYFALTNTRLSHILFILFILGITVLAAINIWTHSSIF